MMRRLVARVRQLFTFRTGEAAHYLVDGPWGDEDQPFCISCGYYSDDLVADPCPGLVRLREEGEA